jgi:hypothetical protein
LIYLLVVVMDVCVSIVPMLSLPPQKFVCLWRCCCLLLIRQNPPSDCRAETCRCGRPATRMGYPCVTQNCRSSVCMCVEQCAALGTLPSLRSGWRSGRSDAIEFCASRSCVYIRSSMHVYTRESSWNSAQNTGMWSAGAWPISRSVLSPSVILPPPSCHRAFVPGK